MATPGDSNGRLAPFLFLDLPFELRSQIINHSISGLTSRPPAQSGGFRTGDEIEPHDFAINASGLKCHFLKSVNLLSVNRQIRHETMAIIFHQCSVSIEVEIPRYGGPSKVNTSVPGILNALNAYPLLCKMARNVTVIFRPESAIMSGPLWQLDGDATSLIRQDLKTLVFIGLCLVFLTPIHILAKVSSWAHRTTPFQGRHADLRVLVNTLAHGFKSHKSLKVIVYLNDLYMQDLKAILGLFEAPSCCVSFEERWLLWDGCPAERPHVLGKSEANYKRFIEQAAEEVGNKIILSVPPSLEELEIDTTDDGDVRGNKIIVKRRRLWLEEVL